MKRLSFALVKSVYVQWLTQTVKRTDEQLAGLSFEGIRKRLIFHHIGRVGLDRLMKQDDLLHEEFHLTDLFSTI
jgi:hypothetical protein